MYKVMYLESKKSHGSLEFSVKFVSTHLFTKEMARLGSTIRPPKHINMSHRINT